MGIVIVGLDGSDNSRAALRVAVTEAMWRNAAVHAVHVVHFPAAMGFDPIMVDFDTIRAAGQSLLDEEIADLIAEYPNGLPVEITTSVRLGHTGIELLQAGEHMDEPVVLTVVGARGTGGFVGLLVGSATNYLVHHLTGPLLVVPGRRSVAEETPMEVVK